MPLAAGAALPRRARAPVALAGRFELAGAPGAVVFAYLLRARLAASRLGGSGIAYTLAGARSPRPPTAIVLAGAALAAAHRTRLSLHLARRAHPTGAGAGAPAAPGTVALAGPCLGSAAAAAALGFLVAGVARALIRADWRAPLPGGRAGLLRCPTQVARAQVLHLAGGAGAGRGIDHAARPAHAGAAAQAGKPSAARQAPAATPGPVLDSEHVRPRVLPRPRVVRSILDIRAHGAGAGEQDCESE